MSSSRLAKAKDRKDRPNGALALFREPPRGLDEEELVELLTRVPVESRPMLSRAWRKAIARLFPLGGSSRGNRITLYHEGDAAFSAMLAAIDGAQHRVWMETYIFETDALGTRVRDALAAAAKRGCVVILLYDQWGSPHVTREFLDPLRQAGGRTVAFNPVSFKLRVRLFQRRRPQSDTPLHFRDHRKILIVDDEVGFAGGMNISMDYAGETLGNGRFRDTHARIEGPAVRDLAHVFQDSFREATNTTPAMSDQVIPVKGGTFVQVLGSNVRRRRRHIQRSIRETVRQSIERCYLTTPYFVPPQRLMKTLTDAAGRGVDVRILTAGLSDVPIARLASTYLYPRLLRAGVRIFEMQERTLHAKTSTIDGLYATVGSFNLDFWSHRRMLEVNVAFLDPELATELEAEFGADLAMATEVKRETMERRSIITRLISWFSYQSMRI